MWMHQVRILDLENLEKAKGPAIAGPLC